jgi:hypothetical protein
VTGVLHMGHMLNNTIQDVLVRRARMQGKNACWVPGTDHASIATEVKVVRLLQEQGIKKSVIGREDFLKHAFAWKEKYGGVILEQLKKLGASCDWDRTRFTMEPDLSEAVIDVFIDLHKKGLVYRGLRMVNWDPAAQTTVSDEEVIYLERTDPLVTVRYSVVDANGKDTGETIEVGDLRLDPVAHKVQRRGRALQLGPTEYRLLKFFMESPGRVFSRGQLLDGVWGTGSDIELRTVDVHIRRLRKAIGIDGAKDPIRTVRSAGYALESN